MSETLRQNAGTISGFALRNVSTAKLTVSQHTLSTVTLEMNLKALNSKVGISTRGIQNAVFASIICIRIKSICELLVPSPRLSGQREFHSDQTTHKYGKQRVENLYQLHSHTPEGNQILNRNLSY